MSNILMHGPIPALDADRLQTMARVAIAQPQVRPVVRAPILSRVFDAIFPAAPKSHGPALARASVLVVACVVVFGVAYRMGYDVVGPVDQESVVATLNDNAVYDLADSVLYGADHEDAYAVSEPQGQEDEDGFGDALWDGVLDDLI